MQRHLLVFLLIVTCPVLSGQNLVGYKAAYIKEYMKENEKAMKAEQVKNESYSYLKYTDSYERETALFFLDDDSVCNAIRLICDNSLRSSRVKEFDSTFKRTGDSEWTDTQKGKDYLIKISDGQLSTDIIIVQKK